MKRIALVAGLLLVAAGLAGVLRPDGAGAADPATMPDTVTVTGTGSVSAVPDRAEISAGVETRASTAKAALAANGATMQKVIAALRANGGSDVTTQTVSLSTAFDQNGQPNGFVASNVASAQTSLNGAGALIDAAVAAGANTVYGPSLSRSDADELYRQALADPIEPRPPREESGVPGPTSDESVVLGLFDDPRPVHVDRLAESAPFGIARLQAALLGLVLGGRLDPLPGGYYVARPRKGPVER